MSDNSFAIAEIWKKERQDLRIKRNSLFEKYSRSPHDVHLALQIKTIDDEIAECTAKMQEVKLAERKSKGLPLVSRGATR